MLGAEVRPIIDFVTEMVGLLVRAAKSDPVTSQIQGKKTFL